MTINEKTDVKKFFKDMAVDTKPKFKSLRNLYQETGNQEGLDSLALAVLRHAPLEKRAKLLNGLMVSTKLARSLATLDLCELLISGAEPKVIFSDVIVQRIDCVINHNSELVFALAPLRRKSSNEFAMVLHESPELANRIDTVVKEVKEKEAENKISGSILTSENREEFLSTLKLTLKDRQAEDIIELLHGRPDLVSIFMTDSEAKQILVDYTNTIELFHRICDGSLKQVGLALALFDDLFDSRINIINHWIKMQREVPLDVYLNSMLDGSIRQDYGNLDQLYIGSLEYEAYRIHKSDDYTHRGY